MPDGIGVRRVRNWVEIGLSGYSWSTLESGQSAIGPGADRLVTTQFQSFDITALFMGPRRI